MTQMQTAPVLTAMVVPGPFGRFTVETFPLQTVEEAREEFGPTLADAQAFVQQTACLDCGVCEDELRECSDCGIRACNCVVVEDGHVDDLYWCLGCQRVCGCDNCNC